MQDDAAGHEHSRPAPGSKVPVPKVPAAKIPAPRAVVIRGEPVMLAADVAQAFEVETREIAQAIKRNPQKFDARHTFQLTEAERDHWRSLNVISGRGWMPTVLTQKGVVRLATVLNAPKALEATDQIIDLFVEIYGQLRQGRTDIALATPSRLVPAGADIEHVRSLRRRIIEGLGALLDTTIDTRTRTTIGDALGESATGALDHLKALFKTQRLKNDQFAAETLSLLEKTRDMYERRQADLRKSSAETERLVLENVKIKIDLVQQLLSMTDRLEPGALARVLPNFLETDVLLPAPEPAEHNRDED